MGKRKGGKSKESGRCENGSARSRSAMNGRVSEYVCDVESGEKSEE